MVFTGVMVLFLWAVAQASTQQTTHGRAAGRERELSPKLQKKMDTLERLVLEQNVKMDRLGRLLGEQDVKLSHQQQLLHQQSAKLSEQEGLLHDKDVRLSQQEQMLSHYGHLIQKLTSTTLNSPSTKGNTESSLHAVSSRSDDSGPLEVVINQLSQQVTEMKAGIESFKTQTETEMQTLTTKMSSDIKALQANNSARDQHIKDAQSSTFVHWGSSQCNSSSELVYSGVVGGSWYLHGGGATNYLCLTMSPVFEDPPALPSYVASLYGAEYETHDSHQDKKPVCAVCRPAYTTTVMVPGSNVCSPGWHLQYSGYLMAGYSFHASGSEYICVDSKLESRISGNADQDGRLLFYTVTHCGSLPCTPYANNKLVLCAVCSK